MAPHIYSAAKATATGASITLGSTVFSCYLAIKIEAAGHRTLFSFFPHWYANVEHAHGIDPDKLASNRMICRQKVLDEQKTQHIALVAEEKKQKDDLRAMEDPTKTIFTVEGLVEPTMKRVQGLSTIDLGACAMTA